MKNKLGIGIIVFNDYIFVDRILQELTQFKVFLFTSHKSFDGKINLSKDCENYLSKHDNVVYLDNIPIYDDIEQSQAEFFDAARVKLWEEGYSYYLLCNSNELFLENDLINALNFICENHISSTYCEYIQYYRSEYTYINTRKIDIVNCIAEITIPIKYASCDYTKFPNFIQYSRNFDDQNSIMLLPTNILCHKLNHIYFDVENELKQLKQDYINIMNSKRKNDDNVTYANLVFSDSEQKTIGKYYDYLHYAAFDVMRDDKVGNFSISHLKLPYIQLNIDVPIKYTPEHLVYICLDNHSLTSKFGRVISNVYDRFNKFYKFKIFTNTKFPNKYRNELDINLIESKDLVYDLNIKLSEDIKSTRYTHISFFYFKENDDYENMESILNSIDNIYKEGDNIFRIFTVMKNNVLYNSKLSNDVIFAFRDDRIIMHNNIHVNTVLYTALLN